MYDWIQFGEPKVITGKIGWKLKIEPVSAVLTVNRAFPDVFASTGWSRGPEYATIGRPE